MQRWRGLEALAHDLVDATTFLVGEGHASVARNVRRVTDQIPGVAGPAEAVDAGRAEVTEAILASVRAVNRVVEQLAGVGWQAAGPGTLPPPIPLRSDAAGTAPWAADALIGAVNGLAGDHLAATHNPLDLGFSLRVAGAPSARLAVWVHGLSTTEWSWALDGDNFGERLERDAGFSPVFARYNTGRPVAVNGKALSAALTALVQGWPVPVEAVVLVGHSMGGLVARSAVAQGDPAWTRLLTDVISLGTPHRGAPLARFAELSSAILASVDLPGTRIAAKILEVRSAGIRDLQTGGPLADEPVDVPGVKYTFLAGTIAPDPGGLAGEWLGDGMVGLDSAGGPDPALDRDHARFGGVPHHRLQVDPGVYTYVLGVLRPS
jgi:hypothetical protein